MRRIIITTALLLCTATAAGAQGPAAYYRDLVRPNGHPRSDAVHQADVEACYQQTGASRYLPDNAAMKKCMLSHGYRFQWQRGPSGSGTAVAGSNYRIHTEGLRGSCMQRQAQTANIIESLGGGMMSGLVQQLRTRCLPQDHNPADYDPFNKWYVPPASNFPNN